MRGKIKSSKPLSNLKYKVSSKQPVPKTLPPHGLGGPLSAPYAPDPPFTRYGNKGKQEAFHDARYPCLDSSSAEAWDFFPRARIRAQQREVTGPVAN